LSDGLTDALITGLARAGTLRVISRTSAMEYKGVHKQLPQIARELHVDAVLEGSVFRSGNRVRIGAKLVRAATDQSLFAETYEGDLSDVLALQNGISMAIAHRVEVKLTPWQERELSNSIVTNTQAYEAYLKGRFFWNKRSLEGLNRAIGYFQQAIAKDPRSALAYAGLADCFNMLSFYGGAAPRESFPKAQAAALKALELDQNLGEAHAALAFSRLHHDWDWKSAEAGFRRAIVLNPNYSNARHWYSHYLLASGRSEDALIETRKVLETGPAQPQHQHAPWPSLLVHAQLRSSDHATAPDPRNGFYRRADSLLVGTRVREQRPVCRSDPRISARHETFAG
jgi:TolB-like protein